MQGFGEGSGGAVRRVQLLRSAGLHGYGQVLQRISRVSKTNPLKPTVIYLLIIVVLYIKIVKSSLLSA